MPTNRTLIAGTGIDAVIEPAMNVGHPLRSAADSPGLAAHQFSAIAGSEAPETAALPLPAVLPVATIAIARQRDHQWRQ